MNRKYENAVNLPKFTLRLQTGCNLRQEEKIGWEFPIHNDCCLIPTASVGMEQ